MNFWIPKFWIKLAEGVSLMLGGLALLRSIYCCRAKRFPCPLGTKLLEIKKLSQGKEGVELGPCRGHSSSQWFWLSWKLNFQLLYKLHITQLKSEGIEFGCTLFKAKTFIPPYIKTTFAIPYHFVSPHAFIPRRRGLRPPFHKIIATVFATRGETFGTVT